MNHKSSAIWPDWVTCVTCGNEITAKEAFCEDIPYCNEECYEHYQTNGQEANQ